MSRPEEPAITLTPFSLRQWSLENEVKPTFAKAFAERPKVQSILLCVAQYWADEADDAVHGHLVFSSRATPRWPHQCEDQYSGTAGDGDLCSSCAWDATPEGMTTWVDWNDNGMAIRAWQSLCTEGASQEDDPNTVYAAAVLARRSGDAFTMHTVGPVMRPWLELPNAALPAWFQEQGDAAPIANVVIRDAAEQPFRDAIARAPLNDGPRHVFADWLQQREDPLGEFISLSLMPSRSIELEQRRRVLLAANVEAWLGDLIHVVAPGSADFSRGLLTGATVHFDESTRALADSPQFATVETLRFGETSEVIYSKTMTALRSVAGVGPRSPSLPTTVTELVCDAEFARDFLPLQVTSVTVICRGGQPEAEALAMLEKAQVLPRLQRLSLVRLELAERGPTRVEWSARSCELSVGGWTAANTPTGWWVDARGTLRLEGLSQLSSDAAAVNVVSVLPSPALTLEPGSFWTPSEKDVSTFARIAAVPVTVRDATPTQEPPPLDQPRRDPPRAMPVRVDPITRSVQVELPDVVKDISAPIAGRPPLFPMLVLMLGIAGLIARACVAG